MTTRSQIKAPPPIDIYKYVLTLKYADFSGRARRAEYWWFGLVNFAVMFGAVVLAAILGAVNGAFASLFLLVAIGVYLATILPGLAISVRRLHDTGKSGWYLLIGLLPFGGIVVLIFMATDSTPSTNEYGPSPKYPS